MVDPIESRSRHDREIPGVERLLALSDGVAAIALTLLVLTLGVPVRGAIRHADSAGDLASYLSTTRFSDQFESYVVAFFVIASFWLAHHRTFRMVRGHSEGLAWWNFAYLFTITLVPFTSNVAGRFSDNPLAVSMFSANLLLVSLSTQATVVYARRRDLLIRGLSERELLVGRLRGAVVTTILIASTGVAWASTDGARYLYLLILLTGPVSARVGARYAP